MTQKLPITELDFFTNKEKIKEFLKAQNRFKDYDFEGSNFNVLLDVLAYNSYQSNFYTNMAFSEMFLDSAGRKDSAVSHAKELNYLPRSAKSARARLRVVINRFNDTASTITIPRGTEFSASYNGMSYIFTNERNYVARKVDSNLYVAEDVEVFEGVTLQGYQREGFFVDSKNMKCILNNDFVDISSIQVSVNSDTNVFTRAEDTVGVSKDARVFFVEPHFDGQYAVTFGQNIFGLQPSINDDIRISYRVSSGAAVNGAKKFTTSFLPDNIIVECTSQAAGASDPETLEDIRYFAPKSIQIQERAIVANDYEVLIKQRFPEVQSIAVFGGEELNPPRYGTVGISVNLTGDAKLTDGLKTTIKEFISAKASLGTRLVFLDSEFVNAKMTVEVFVNRSLTKTPSDELEKKIRDAIAVYNRNFLEDFGAVLRTSRLSGAIDSIEPAFVGTTVAANPIVEFTPELNKIYNQTFDVKSPLARFYPFDAARGFDNYESALKSTVFKYRGMCCYMHDDGKGTLQIVRDDKNNQKVVNVNAGTINYSTGSFTLSNFIVEGFSGGAIRFTIQTNNSDIQAPNNRILTIDDTDVTIILTDVRE